MRVYGKIECSLDVRGWIRLFLGAGISRPLIWGLHVVGWAFHLVSFGLKGLVEHSRTGSD